LGKKRAKFEKKEKNKIDFGLLLLNLTYISTFHLMMVTSLS